jgi:hypothetical protein
MTDTPRPLNQRYLERKRRRLARVRAGIPQARLVDVQPTIEHLRKLRDFGMSQQSIAQLSGVPYQTLGGLLWESHCQWRSSILSTTEAAILAVTFNVADLPPGAKVTAIGVTRRIRALARIGWTNGYVASQVGMTTANLNYLTGQKRVTVETYLRIAGVYKRLARIEGPSVRAQVLAARKGWPSPGAWDDDIDDPTAQPHGTEHIDGPAPIVGRPPTRKIADLRKQGKTAEEIAEVLRMDADRVAWVLERMEGEAA